MAEQPDAPGEAAHGLPGRISRGLVFGWAITVLGAMVTLGTIGVSLFVVFSADTTKQFAALLVSAFFFAAFPALTGLGLIIWGRKLVLRSRAGSQAG